MGSLAVLAFFVTTNIKNRRRKSERIEKREKDKRKEEEQREAKGKLKKNKETEERKEAQKGFEDKGRRTYSLRYNYYRVANTQPD